MPHRDGLAEAIIAVWGKVELEPLGSADVSKIASGGSYKGLLVGFLGDLERSAKADVPVYELAGGSGFVWAATFDENGRGVIRFLTIDASQIARLSVAQVAGAEGTETAKDYAVGPAANVLCSTFNYTVPDREPDNAYYAWATGYLTALNSGWLLTRGKMRHLNQSPEWQKAWLRSYCRQHPDHSYAIAVFFMWNTFTEGSSLVERGPRPPERETEKTPTAAIIAYRLTLASLTLRLVKLSPTSAFPASRARRNANTSPGRYSSEMPQVCLPRLQNGRRVAGPAHGGVASEFRPAHP